ncbi:MAG: hypothetical protein ACXABD_19190 [Candidatus Thorarchaeota archaeon]|jgi:formylmethanofuran dehydrogenase subunit B
MGLCRLGHEHLVSASRWSGLKAKSRKDGKEKAIPQDGAIEIATDMLLAAKNPLLLGWTHSTNETIREGLALATSLKAFFDTGAFMGMGSAIAGELHSNKLEIDLEWVRNRAEIIFYLGSNPTESSHRHPSRFAALPRGEKIPEGIESRTIGVVDVRETETMKMANHRIIIPIGKDAELLRALAGDISGTSSITGPVLGVPAAELVSLTNKLKKSDGTVFFYGSGIINSGQGKANFQALNELLSALRDAGTEAFALPMSPETNIMGAIQIGGFSSALQKLRSSEYDIALVVGDDSLATLPGHAAKELARIPIIYIGPSGGLTEKRAVLSIETADNIVSGRGSMLRLDQVEFELKPWSTGLKDLVGELELITKLHQQINEKSGK